MSFLLLVGFTSYASNSDTFFHVAIDSTIERTYKANEPYVFVERGVEFAVFPNGEFDFAYVGFNYEENPYKTPNRPFSYNGGYNYDMYLQFDIFGAVIQIETVPVYYDNYGRIIQAGSVDISYSEDAIVQIGNMHIQYQKGIAKHLSKGYINLSDKHLVKRPQHIEYYLKPHSVIVSHLPYRENIEYERYSFEQHKKLYEASKTTGSKYEYGRRTFLDPETTTPRGLVLADNGGKYLSIISSDEGLKNISDLRTRNEVSREHNMSSRKNASSNYSKDRSSQLNSRRSGSSSSIRKSGNPSTLRKAETTSPTLKKSTTPSLQSVKK